MSYRRLAEALLQGQPYFGPALRSLQGLAGRHQYILPVVKAVAIRPGVEILEIGSWAGASAVSWASALKKLGRKGRVTCVDAWRPYFDLDKEKEGIYQRMNRAAENGMIYKLFQHNVASSGFTSIIRAKPGKSRKVLPKLAARSFDVVYLDGSHMFEDVLFDVRQAKRLVRPGGIVCGDDLEMQLKDLDPAEVELAARSRHDYVPASTSGTYYHPGVTLAVAREFGEVSAWDGFWTVRWSGKKWQKVILDLTGLELPEHVAAVAITIEGATLEHHLISSGGRYFALSKQLGPPDIVAELLGDEDLPPLVFMGSTLGEIREKLQRHHKARTAAKSASEDKDLYTTPQLVDSYRDFNLVLFKSNVYGFRLSLGKVDLSADDAVKRYGDQDAVIGDSLDGVRARIDAIEAQRAVQELEARLQELENEKHPPEAVSPAMN